MEGFFLPKMPHSIREGGRKSAGMRALHMPLLPAAYPQIRIPGIFFRLFLPELPSLSKKADGKFRLTLSFAANPEAPGLISKSTQSAIWPAIRNE